MSEDVLERIYQESLEERIIFYLAEKEKISLEKAMKLANRIHQGEYGIQYLDYKVLVQILCETEPDLVRKV